MEGIPGPGRAVALVALDLSMTGQTRTFLFTDIEGSYRLWERHPDRMPGALAAHDRILQSAVERNDGRVFKTIGDAVCAVFAAPVDGARAAVDAQRALHAADWTAIGLTQPLTVRMAVQAGEAQEREGDFTGLVLNRISRLLRAGHGGQVLVSGSVASDLERIPLGGVGLRDLGERRLRDVPGAHRIYQLEIDGLPASFPPLETLDTVAHNLPVALNTCLDRESELAQIRSLLLDSPTRLVTLIGPGGIGKTRLALHAAMQLIDAFSGGIWFVDLSLARDASAIPAAVAAAMGGRIELGSDLAGALAAQTGDRNLLLILDNCEQIADGVAGFVAELLPRATCVRLLATSRVPLHIRGEQRVEIGPLPVEAEETAGPAVQLFLERAQQIRPSFELTDANRESIIDICHRVDGIPLALELAAARVAVLSPDALRSRLNSRLSLLTSSSRDLPERHQTLRSAIDWSYALLSEEEQRAFRQLAVFQGGWSFGAAQAVLGAGELETMEVLASLRDKSLVRLAETDDGEPRYSMLETIQEYGLEQLSASGDLVSIRSAHARYFAGLTDQAQAPMEGGPLQAHWLTILDRDVANLRMVLLWYLESGDAERTIDVCLNLWGYWTSRGLLAEGHRWFEQALELAETVDPLLRAAALRRIGNLCVERGDLPAAETFYRSSLDIVQGSADQLGLAQSLSSLGMVEGMQGRSEAEYRYQIQALELCRTIGPTRGTITCLVNLGVWARNIGQIGEAFRFFGEALELQLELRDDYGAAFTHVYLAQIREDAGELDAALVLIDSAEQRLDALNDQDGLSFAWMRRASIERKRGNLALAKIHIENAIEQMRSRGDRLTLASAFEIQAIILAQSGSPVPGAEALGAADHLRTRTNAPISPIDAPDRDAAISELQAVLGEARFSVHRELGKQEQIRDGWRDAA